MGSLVCSNLYLVQLRPSVTNDYWWPGFNTSGIQTFLADLFNAKLSLLQTGRLDLTNASVATVSAKSYADPAIQMEWSSSYGRQLLLSDLPLAKVVSALRANSIDVNWAMFPAYCWLDLTRLFDMAHTAKRQLRCDRLYRANGAVYVELLLRNVASNALVASSSAAAINVTILAYLLSTDAGVEWLDRVQNHVWLSVADEVTVWHRAGVVSWTNQVQNMYDIGVTDSIVIENALGYQQVVAIKKSDLEYRGLGLWTTYLANIGIWNDWALCQYFGCSLIRQANNSVDKLGLDWDVDILGPLLTPGTALVRDFLGPFTAIDVHWVATPIELIQFVAAFQEQFVHAASSSIKGEPPPVVVDPVPPSWVAPNRLFLGGNPMCPFGAPLAFVQDSFGYADGCTSQDPLVVYLTPQSMVFAMQFNPFARQSSPNATKVLCSVCIELAQACEEAAGAMVPLAEHVSSILTTRGVDAARVAARVALLNISIMQLATEDSGDFVLTNALVAPGLPLDSNFAIFGWAMVYDWAVGTREVIAFDGDNGSITLMSRWSPLISMAANPLELPHHACNYIWFISIYVSFVLTCVGGLAVACLKARPDRGTSRPLLFSFNRLIGSVWVGRPMLFVRGMAAVIVLSTSPVTFEHTPASQNHLTMAPRSLAVSMVLAGEVTWLSYVLHDILLPFEDDSGHLIGPATCAINWIFVIAWDQLAPLAVAATVDPVCTIERLGHQVSCTSGVVAIGNVVRLVCMTCLVLVVPGGLHALVYVARRLRTRDRGVSIPTGFVAVPAMAASLLRHQGTSPSINDDILAKLDAMTLVMAGLLPTRREPLQVFSVSLWQTLRPRDCRGTVCLVQQVVPPHPAPPFVVRTGCMALLHGPTLWLRAFLGFLYVVGTMSASFTYLARTQSTMSNDVWWATFNATSHQTFLINWFNTQLQTTTAPREANLRLDAVKFGDVQHDYTTPARSTVSESRLYAAHLQSQVNTLSAVIVSLRHMDGCLVPWIATSYCYVDFDQMWEMASSASRQATCRHKRHNGAVFLETILRNVDWPSLMQCWGVPLEAAVLAPLRRSVAGRHWVAHVQENALAVPDEETLWRGHGIDVFTPQWQNYKTLGAAESITVENAFGLGYPVTVKQSTSTFQGIFSTSLRRQWPLARLLDAATTNWTGAVFSLVKGSSAPFLFDNYTMEDVVLGHHMIAAPWGLGLALSRDLLGPFGTSSLHRIPPPSSLLSLFRSLTQTILSVRGQHEAADTMFASFPVVKSYNPLPPQWSQGTCHGGDLLCELNDPFFQPYLFVSNDGLCSSQGIESIVDASYMLATAALLLVTRPGSQPPNYCKHDTKALAACRKTANATAEMLTAFVPHDHWQAMRDTGRSVQQHVSSNYNPQIMQYFKDMTNVDSSAAMTISRVDLFQDTDFDFFSWLYMFDWAHGVRELVRFESEDDTTDTANVTLLSAPVTLAATLPNAQEIPQNVALYLRSALQYVTFVLLCVASLVGVSILVNRGRVEGANMFQFNRVAAVVWIGRPLMVLRGVTAICLLSTASLDLTRVHGNFCQFASRPPDTVTTLLSSGEMGWVVYVVNDVMSVFTHRFTYDYAWKSCVLVWLVAAVWSILLPVEHVVTVDRHCAVDAVDFQLTCHGGTVAIGRFDRFWGLLVVAAVSCVVCYAVERVRNTAVHPRRSVVLHSAAQYQFDQANWMFQGVYHMDTSSAILNGLLVVPYRTDKVVFDIKSWRVFIIKPTPDLPPQLRQTVAMIE